MPYNSSEYYKNEIKNSIEEYQNLAIDLIKAKLFEVAKDKNISHKEYLFICESLDKNKENLKIT